MSDLADLITAGAALVAVSAGYVQFVLRRLIHPCLEFDVDLLELGSRSTPPRVCELTVTISNRGPGMGFVDRVQGRIRYRAVGESDTGRDGLEPAFGHSLTPAERPGVPGGDGPTDTPVPATRILGKNAFVFVEERKARNFIQPGVTQYYRKPLALPAEADLVHVWCAFEYHIDIGRVSWALARFVTSRPKGKIVDYTVRRTFADGSPAPVPDPGKTRVGRRPDPIEEAAPPA